MFNSRRPDISDLPTSGQLLRATAIAAATAGALLVTIVLPAEYAIDPTGLGRSLGFTEMGEIKRQLAQEAAADAAPTALAAGGAMPVEAQGAREPAAAAARSDVTRLTLAPGEGAEVKATMARGVSLTYDWSVAGGAVNYDKHGDPVSAPRGFYHGYGKGRGSPGQKGALVAAFDGKHGWFWRNRGDAAVTITLRTQGRYTQIKRVV